MADRYWLASLGCPKNQVDSDKLEGALASDGCTKASRPQDADVIVVNTCAFIEAAREESIAAILELADTKREDARLVVTGCMAERYGNLLTDSMPEIDMVAGFGVPITLRTHPEKTPIMDLLELPRPPTASPWAYVKIAEGCDRKCGFCAIPSFRGPQRSRTKEAIIDEVASLGTGVREIVLVAQDLASWGMDISVSRPLRARAMRRPVIDLIDELRGHVERLRLLYIYPSAITKEFIEAVCATGIPYFDISLQHCSPSLLRRMRRSGSRDRFLRLVESIRSIEPNAILRSSFVVGYPGETDEDHAMLLDFLEKASLDWAGFFPFSLEEGTYAAGLDGQVPAELALERQRECSAVQETIMTVRRASHLGQTVEVLVDSPGESRSYMEAPEIDGVIQVPRTLKAGTIVPVVITGLQGSDLIARPAKHLATPQTKVVNVVTGDTVGDALGNVVSKGGGNIEANSTYDDARKSWS
ncbi:MAG: 30S ribosomal protein S12 methylthiotransferase RimO [Actinobacteria bacterium]|nr:30S ribosomal protein S12 methylthiotransferase RimO [Actinomycetota bacterium]MCL5447339.1 30S ribosomal protein S12 methylthiotransferase RimO [Actinomycetota bacterium]